jgi:hypothetical protein
MRSKQLALCIGVAAMSLAIGCENKPPEPKPTSGAGSAALTDPGKQKVNAPTKAAQQTRAQASPGAIGWTKPDAWKEGPSKPMRKATFLVDPADGDTEGAEMSVSQVGGSVDANIARWEGQFTEKPKAKTHDIEVNGLKVTIVEIEGTFTGAGGSKEGWVMLAAIVHTKPSHFFKMWGPNKTITAARGDFDKFVETFAPK